MSRSRLGLTSTVPTESATTLILTFTASCAFTVAATRAYLALTGYPQIGGAVFHLAHALWGGLLLTITTLLMLTVAGRWVAPTCAVLGGVGAGLFVDEVGKFVTKKNDYFFPLAASIVYIFLVLLAGATVMFARYARSSGPAHLHAALELADQLNDGRTITPGQAQRMAEHLAAAHELTTSPSARVIVRGLTEALAAADPSPRELPRALRRLGGARSYATGWFTDRRVRRLLITLLILQGIGGIGTLIALVLAMVSDIRILPGAVNDLPLGTLATTLAVISLVVTSICGLASLYAARCVTRRWRNVKAATRVGGGAMVVLLLVGNSLAAYIDQFAVLVDAALQVLTLGLLGTWVRSQRATDDLPTVDPVANADRMAGD